LNRLRLARCVLLGLLAWLALYPLGLLFAETPVAALRGVLADRVFWSALWQSLWISLASTALAALIGVPLAFLFGLPEFPGRRIAARLLALPVALPPLVGVLTFLFLFGESGVLARGVQAIAGSSEPPWHFRGPLAILLVHAYSMYVYFYLFAQAALERRDRSLEEAAAALGAGKWRRLWRLQLPLLRPALAGAAVLAFMTALGSFSAPYFFGGGARLLTTQIFNAKLNGDIGAAQAQSLFLAVVALAGLWVAQRFEGSRAVIGARPVLSARRRRGGLSRWVVAPLAWGAVLLVLAPHLTLLLLALRPEQGSFGELSWANFAALGREAERLRPLVNSLWMAIVATAGAVAIGLAVALASRGAPRWGGWLRALVAVPWAVPGTVLAVALAATWSVRAPWFGRWVLIGTPILLPLAYMIRSLPSTGRAAWSGLRQIEPALEEAAATLGAGRWRRLRRVLLPLLAPSLLAGASLAFLASAGDFVLSVVLYTYETRPISMEILSSLRLQEVGVAAAYGVILALAGAVTFLLWGTRENA
jgi:iron(III) transport system permease protein